MEIEKNHSPANCISRATHMPWMEIHLNNPNNQIFERMKKTPGDIIILHKCIKNHDHMLYCSWYMTCDEYNCYFSFWDMFCPFTPLIAQKIKNIKKGKNAWTYHHFTQVFQKIMIICYAIPEIWLVLDIIVIFQFGLFFVLFPLKSLKN